CKAGTRFVRYIIGDNYWPSGRPILRRLGLPISKYAVNHNLNDVVVVSLAIWSAMTTGSSSVANCRYLLLARIGVVLG
ncbi:MAG: hypothetical protein ACI9K1_000852, partial [Arcticibacterium sp.]